MKIIIRPHRVGDGINTWYGVRYEVETLDGCLEGTAKNEAKALREIRRRVRRMERAYRQIERIQR
jgi:hypothetical protein